MNEAHKEMKAAVERLTKRHGPLNLEFSWLVVCAVIANLELALRHPDNNGEPARIARKTIKGMYETFEYEEPALAAILRGLNLPD